MPITQNVHAVFFQSQAVVNDIRTGNQFANAGTFQIRRADEREILQYRNSVNQGMAYANGGIGVVLGDESDGGP